MRLQAVQVLQVELPTPDKVEVRYQHAAQRAQQRRVADQPPHEALQRTTMLLTKP